MKKSRWQRSCDLRPASWIGQRAERTRHEAGTEGKLKTERETGNREYQADGVFFDPGTNTAVKLRSRAGDIIDLSLGTAAALVVLVLLLTGHCVCVLVPSAVLFIRRHQAAKEATSKPQLVGSTLHPLVCL